MNTSSRLNLILAVVWAVVAAYYTDKGIYGGAVWFGLFSLGQMTIAIVYAIEGKKK